MLFFRMRQGRRDKGKRKRAAVSQEACPHPWAYYPNACSSQGGAGLKPRARNSVQVSSVGGRKTEPSLPLPGVGINKKLGTRSLSPGGHPGPPV